MTAHRLRKELFLLRKAFFPYHQGFRYIYGKFFLARRIYGKGVIEKPVNNNDLSIHVLTGSADLTMLLWSLLSFYRQATEIGRLHIHDDGTLTQRDLRVIEKHLPTAKVVSPDEIFSALGSWPTIRKFRTAREYFLLKKIVDGFFLSDAKMHLVIDSDLYWFSCPAEIEDSIKKGAPRSLAMKNSAPCHVYFKNEEFPEDKAMVNTGAVLYHKDNFNVQKLSDYLEKIDTARKENGHFIEQAGFAYALENLDLLPEKRYAIKGGVTSATVLRHYTSPRRALFYAEAVLDAVRKYF